MVVHFYHFCVAGTQPVTYQIPFPTPLMMVRATHSFRKETHNRLQMTLLSIYMFICSSKCPWIFFCKPMESLPIISLGATSCIFKICCAPHNFSHFPTHDFCNCSLSFRTKSCQNPIAHFKIDLRVESQVWWVIWTIIPLWKFYALHTPSFFSCCSILWASVFCVIVQSQKTLILCLLIPEACIYFVISFCKLTPAGKICIF